MTYQSPGMARSWRMNSSTGSASSSSSAALSSVSSESSSPVASSPASAASSPSAASPAASSSPSTATSSVVAGLMSSAAALASASALSSLACSSGFRSGSDTIALLSVLPGGLLRAGSSGRPWAGPRTRPQRPSSAAGSASAEDRDDQLGKAVVQAGDDRNHHHDERQGDGRVRSQFPPGRPDHLAQFGDALTE